MKIKCIIYPTNDLKFFIGTFTGPYTYLGSSARSSSSPSFVFPGLDESEMQIYLKYSLSDESNELTRESFDWIPRLDTWEHLCFVKKPEVGKKFSQLKFFVNGENKGQSKK